MRLNLLTASQSCCPLFQYFHMDDLDRDDIHYNFMISGDGSDGIEQQTPLNILTTKVL